MRLMVGHSTNWSEAYGVIEDIQDYNLNKSMALPRSSAPVFRGSHYELRHSSHSA
jgi:hypothetical protein